MKTTGPLLGLVMSAALAGCGGGGDEDPLANAGGTTAGGAGGASGAAGSAAGGTAGGGAGGGGGGAPSDPFTVRNGVCQPRSVPGPEPIYEVDSIFGHVGSMVASGDTLYFAESADFDDVPPRIVKLDAAGASTTVVAGDARQLRIFGTTLYYLEDDTLKSVDLASDGAAPVERNTVADILAYDDQHVIYKDETNIYSVAVGAADLTGAVTLHAAASILSVTIGDGILYLSNGDGVSRVGLDGTGAASVVADDDFADIGLMASDGASLYLDDDDQLQVVPVSGGNPRTFGLAGPDKLFDDTAEFTNILPAGDIIYWADDGESYGWTALDGSRCGILGTHNGIFEGGAALADSYLYAHGEETIYRVDRVE